jgi:peroxidase
MSSNYYGFFILGNEAVRNRRIVYDTQDWVNDYNPNVNPSTLNEHSNAAFRYFHSLVAGRLL